MIFLKVLTIMNNDLQPASYFDSKRLYIYHQEHILFTQRIPDAISGTSLLLPLTFSLLTKATQNIDYLLCLHQHGFDIIDL